MKLWDRRLLELLDRRNLGDLELANKKILVAVSGGADSVALLRALCVYAPSCELELAVVHVNHGIRPESAEEAGFVQALCRELEVPFYLHTLNLGNKPKGSSPEEFWRRERYQAFSQSRIESGADYVALGHNADDLAESFLYHLARGTGPEGLTFHFLSNRASAGLPIIRPIWKTRRIEIEQALSSIQQTWIVDLSNQNLQYSRNRIRKEVIPALERINPAAVTAIIRLADQLTEYIDRDKGQTGLQTFCLEIDQALRDSSYKVLCAAIRNYLSTNLNASHTSRHVEQAADMVRENSSGIVALPESWNLVLTQDFAWGYKGGDPTDLDLAREHCRRFGGLAVDFSGGMETPGSNVLDVMGLDGQPYNVQVSGDERYTIRNRKTGDRIGPKTLKKLLIEYRVPWYLRDYLVLAASADGQVADIITDVKPLKNWVTYHTAGAATLEYSKVSPSA